MNYKETKKFDFIKLPSVQNTCMKLAVNLKPEKIVQYRYSTIKKKLPMRITIQITRAIYRQTRY